MKEGAPWERVSSATSCGRHRAFLACVLLSAACTHSASGTGALPDSGLPDRQGGVTDSLVDSETPVYPTDLPSIESPRGLRLLHPLSACIATTQRPTFRWAFPALEFPVRLQVCSDRQCQRLDIDELTSGSQLRANRTLSPGLHFWRVVPATNQVGISQSPTFAVRIPVLDSNVDSCPSAYLDINGDGLGDAVGSVFSDNPTRSALLTLLGSPRLSEAGGFLEEDSRLADGRWWGWGSADFIGDINGDGYGDVSLGDLSLSRSVRDGDRLPSDASRSNTVLIGGPEGLRMSNSRFHSREDENTGSAQYLGDIDLDGDAEFAILPLFIVFREPSDLFRVLRFSTRLGRFESLYENRVSTFVWIPSWIRRAGDVNGDGYADIFVPVIENPSFGNTNQVALVLGGQRVSFENARLLRLIDGSLLRRRSKIADTASGRCDLDGDGRSDFVSENFGTTPPTVEVFRGVETGLGLGQSISSIGVYSYVRCGGDVNGDGLSEIVAEAEEEVVVGTLRSGAFVQVRRLVPSSGWFFEPGYSQMGTDLNGDGFDELILRVRLLEGAHSRAFLVLFGGSSPASTPTRLITPSRQSNSLGGGLST